MTIKFAKFPRFRFNSLSPFDVQTKAVREREAQRPGNVVSNTIREQPRIEV